MNHFYVYVYLDPFTGDPIYVGKGCHKRAYDQIKAVQKNRPAANKHLGVKLKNYLSYGVCPLIYFAAKDLTEPEAYELETSLILKYGRCNIEPLGTLTNVFTFPDWLTEEKRKKHSDSLKGKKLTPEHRASISAGLKQSEEYLKSRAIVAEKNRGSKRTPDQRKRISESLIGKKKSPQTQEHRNRTSNALKGKPKSKQHCENLSKALKGKTRISTPKDQIYLIKTPTGEEITFIGSFNQFCIDNRLNASSMYNSLRRGSPIMLGVNTGWMLLKVTTKSGEVLMCASMPD